LVYLYLFVLCVISGTIDIQVVVELKNDSEVRGVVVYCDEQMNIMLKDVCLTTWKGKAESYEEMLVKGISIRYVHFPPFISIHAHLSKFYKSVEDRKKKSMPSKIIEKLGRSSAGVSQGLSGKRKIEGIVLDNSSRNDKDDEMVENG
jgi:small nuclear ribonucleoprotein (snRNP)-like protein